MNLIDKNKLNEVKKENKESKIITCSIDNVSIEDQLETFAELIVDQLILQQNEKKSKL